MMGCLRGCLGRGSGRWRGRGVGMEMEMGKGGGGLGRGMSGVRRERCWREGGKVMWCRLGGWVGFAVDAWRSRDRGTVLVTNLRRYGLESLKDRGLQLDMLHT